MTHPINHTFQVVPGNKDAKGLFRGNLTFLDMIVRWHRFLTVKIAKTPSDFGKIFVLRYKVFMLEQGFHEDIEIDEHDDAAIHLFVDNGATAAATLRLFWSGDDVMLGRMAVAKESRWTGIGRALVKRAIMEAKKLGGRYLMAHAQMQALGFYEKVGFEKIGDEFDEEGVTHQLVRFKL